MTRMHDDPGACGRAMAVQDVTGAPVTVHITGFEPFDGAASNASWDAVRFLPEIIELVGGSAIVTRELLPVTFAGAAAAGCRVIEHACPDIVVHVGLGTRAREVRLETTARNTTAARAADNAGRTPAGRLVPGGPSELRATWPAAALVGRLGAAGLPVARSDDAGDYVCNATFYASLAAAAKAPAKARPVIGFVHVPPEEVVPAPAAAQVLRALIVELADLIRRRRASRAGPGRLAVPRGNRVLRVGLTGGIGAGKSAAARLLAARGARVVDADVIAREVVEPGTPGLSEVVEAFGTAVLTADGGLDRAALAARVFTDPRARAELEAITLPRIAQAAARRMEEAGPDGVAVYDVPLLIETGTEDLFDCVLVVEAPLTARLSRLEERGLSRREAGSRMAGQVGDEERRRAADVVLVNNGTEQDLVDGVDWLWEHRVRANISAGVSAGIA